MAEPETYLVLNEEGEVVNAVIWDGETPWEPNENQELLRRQALPEEALEKGVGIGWKRGEAGAWEDRRPELPDAPDTPTPPTPPAPPPKPPAAPAVASQEDDSEE